MQNVKSFFNDKMAYSLFLLNKGAFCKNSFFSHQCVFILPFKAFLKLHSLQGGYPALAFVSNEIRHFNLPDFFILAVHIFWSWTTSAICSLCPIIACSLCLRKYVSFFMLKILQRLSKKIRFYNFLKCLA